MCHALADDALMPDGMHVPQVIFYQSGVGANIPTALGKLIAGMSYHWFVLFHSQYS
jgi:hypothetical protein